MLEAFGSEHARIYKEFPQVVNTGYFIADKLFYPGDALTDPGKPVEILALPVVGPWLKISEAVDYGLMINPKFCFPVHDGMLNEFGGAFYNRPTFVLGDAGIKFTKLLAGESLEV